MKVYYRTIDSTSYENNNTCEAVFFYKDGDKVIRLGNKTITGLLDRAMGENLVFTCNIREEDKNERSIDFSLMPFNRFVCTPSDRLSALFSNSQIFNYSESLLMTSEDHLLNDDDAIIPDHRKGKSSFFVDSHKYRCDLYKEYSEKELTPDCERDSSAIEESVTILSMFNGKQVRFSISPSRESMIVSPVTIGDKNYSSPSYSPSPVK